MALRPYRHHRRARLDQLLAQTGGPRALQLLSGVTDTHLTACSKGRREIGDEMASSLEAATGMAAGWMDTDPAEDAKVPDPREAFVLASYRALDAAGRDRYLAIIAAAFPAALAAPASAAPPAAPAGGSGTPNARPRGALLK